MTVKHEIKSQLAKLLATEDLIVENRNVETAEFNVHTRVLTLPNWERASNNVYDMLVSHEVGHALYTPDRDWWKEKDIPHTFVNIAEDARIEKLMKRRYAGIAKTFFRGYNELSDNDFFEVKDADLNDFNLADRVNLFYKIGAWVEIPFSISEKQIVDLIGNAETFDDTLSAAEALYNLCKKELEKKQKEQEDSPECEQDSPNSTEGGGDFSSDAGDDSEFTVPDSGIDGTVENGDGSTDSVPVGNGTDSVEPQVDTVKALEDAIKGLNSSIDGRETVYIELPKIDLKKTIITNEEIHNGIKQYWEAEEVEYRERQLDYGADPDKCRFSYPDAEFRRFKRDAQKEVNYLVKEFECKKSADAYARSTVAKTGVLDTTKLHTYKYNEDLFKKISVVPDGKNHGLIFILDWSGSMAHVMLDTVKQLYNLLWFCKKVNIPFEVYAFTNNYPIDVPSMVNRYEKKEGVALVEDTFSLMNIFTSKVKVKELEKQMMNIFRIASAFHSEWYIQYHIPMGMNLSGTPLNESLITLHTLIPHFQKENNLQKVQCVVLTDGEGSPLRYTKNFQRHWETEPFLGSNNVSEHCVIRNRKTGYTYTCKGLGYYADVTNLLLKDLRQSFPNTNFIGFRILAGRDAGQFVRQQVRYDETLYEPIMKDWKKNKSFSIRNVGYDTYFGLSSSALDNDSEFEVQQDATKAQIKRAFVKSLRTKKMNKKILGEFVELVA